MQTGTGTGTGIDLLGEVRSGPELLFVSAHVGTRFHVPISISRDGALKGFESRSMIGPDDNDFEQQSQRTRLRLNSDFKDFLEIIACNPIGYAYR